MSAAAVSSDTPGDRCGRSVHGNREISQLAQAAVATARVLNRYEFLITFAPLPIEGGTGSPLNPLAIF